MAGQIIGKTSLSDRFHHLFALEMDKNCFLIDCLKWSDLNYSWVWRWIQSLRGREAWEFDNLNLFLLYFNPKKGEPDRWRWELFVQVQFSVGTLARILDDKWVEYGDPFTTWSRLLPQKVNVFV